MIDFTGKNLSPERRTELIKWFFSIVFNCTESAVEINETAVPPNQFVVRDRSKIKVARYIYIDEHGPFCPETTWPSDYGKFLAVLFAADTTNIEDLYNYYKENIQTDDSPNT